MVYDHTVAFLFDQQAFKFIADTKPDKDWFYGFNHNQFISIWAIQWENASHYNDVLCIYSLETERVKWSLNVLCWVWSLREIFFFFLFFVSNIELHNKGCQQILGKVEQLRQRRDERRR